MERLIRAVAGAAGLTAVVSAPGFSARTHELVLFEPARSAIVARIPLRAEPLRVSYAAGAFWIVAPEQRLVLRLDPRTRALDRRRIGDEPFDATAVSGALWVADHDGGDVLRVALGSGRLTRSRPLGVPQLAIAHAFGSIWSVGADETLRRLNPTTLAVTGSVAGVSSSSEGFEPKIAVTSDALWVSDAAENRVTRVDSRRLRVAYRGRGGGNGVAVGSGGVWSAEGFTDVVRYANGRAARIHVGGGPIDVALTTGAVWTVTRFGRTLVRIDPARDRIVRRIPLGGTPVAVTAGGGLVAVALR